jgi:hypothetical protein
LDSRGFGHHVETLTQGAFSWKPFASKKRDRDTLLRA